MKWTSQDKTGFVLYVTRVADNTDSFISMDSVSTEPTSLCTK